MPILTGIRKSPLDLNNNVKIGVAFPLDETNVFASTETIIEQAKSNLINLLLTNKGERVNLPRYGIGLRSLLFAQNLDIELIQEKIIQSATKYLPNIIIDRVNSRLSKDQQTLFITISYRSTLDGKVDAVQLNFK